MGSSQESFCTALPEVCAARNFWLVFYLPLATAVVYCAARVLIKTARPAADIGVVPNRIVPMAILVALLVAAHAVGYELASEEDSWREFFVAFAIAGTDPVASFVIVPHLWIVLVLLVSAALVAAPTAAQTARPIIKVLVVATLVLNVVGSFWTAWLMDGFN